MADETRTDKVILEELMVSTLAMTDAVTKLLIAKGIITDEEFKTQLSAERANYLAVLKRLQ
jgi:hypothetical protein